MTRHYIADFAGAAHHRNKRNRHASHHLPPLHNSSNSNGDHQAQPYLQIFPFKIDGGGGKAGFSITGCKFYQMTLWAATHTNHLKWIENITRQQDLMGEWRQFFEMCFLKAFSSLNRANCAAPFSK